MPHYSDVVQVKQLIGGLIFDFCHRAKVVQLVEANDGIFFIS